MNIVFFGTPNFVIPVLEALAQEFTVQAVVTLPDAPAGRNRILTPTPIKLAAEQLGLPVLAPLTLDDAFVEQLRDLKPDLLVVASYGKIIPSDVLETAQSGGINIHPSKLPQFRGPSPLQATILSGEDQTAVTIIKMDQEIDHGPILIQKPMPVARTDTFESLAHKAFRFGADLLPQTIRDYTGGGLIPEEQNHNEAIQCNLITKDSGYFDLEKPPSPEHLDRMIRAYYPWPTAWTRWHEKIVKLYPGGKIQMEGKNVVSYKDFFNGYPEAKEVFAKILSVR